MAIKLAQCCAPHYHKLTTLFHALNTITFFVLFAVAYCCKYIKLQHLASRLQNIRVRPLEVIFIGKRVAKMLSV